MDNGGSLTDITLAYVLVTIVNEQIIRELNAELRFDRLTPWHADVDLKCYVLRSYRIGISVMMIAP